MSHFTVLVLHDADEDIDEILAPFNENATVEPYKDRIDLDGVGKVIAFYAEHPDLQTDADSGLTPALVSAAQNADLTGQLAVLRAYHDGNEVGIDDDGFYIMTTYNPDSKWDWYVVGGRWGNHFWVKPEFVGDPRLVVGEQPAIGGFEPQPDRCDGGPKGLLDIQGMREAQGKAAGEAWDKFQAVIAPHPPIKGWPEFVEEVKAGNRTIESARELYYAQPAIKALQGAQLLDWNTGEEEFECARQTFVARAEATAVPGFATVYKGKWIAPGEMGWFAVSTETESSKAGYGEYVNGLIDDASDETYLTLVDCHI